MKNLIYNQNFNSKLNCKFWTEFRPESTYFELNVVYSHLIGNKFIKFGQLINISYKYVDCILGKESYVCLGMNPEQAIEYVKETFGKPQGRQKFNFKDRKIMILTFEEVNEKEFRASQLNLNIQ